MSFIFNKAVKCGRSEYDKKWHRYIHNRSWQLFSKIFLYLKSKKRKKRKHSERKRRGRKRETLPPLVFSPNGYNSQGPTVAAKSITSWATCLCIPRPISRSWMSSSGVRIELRVQYEITSVASRGLFGDQCWSPKQTNTCKLLDDNCDFSSLQFCIHSIIQRYTSNQLSTLKRYSSYCLNTNYNCMQYLSKST